MTLEQPPQVPSPPLTKSRRAVVMGVSGSGKSTLGDAIGKRLGIPYIDGDAYHLQANIDKMSSGISLDDDDRKAWLTALAALIGHYRTRDQSMLLGCSALKRKYRTRLRDGDPDLVFLFLDGSYEVILKRMQARSHFFSPEMLRTQFDTLERPDEREALRVSIHPAFARVVDASVEAILAHDLAVCTTEKKVLKEK